MESSSDAALLTTAGIDCSLYVPTFMGMMTSFLSRCHTTLVFVQSDTVPSVFYSNSYIQALTELSLLLLSLYLLSFLDS